MMFLFRIFKGKKTKPVAAKKTDGRNSGISDKENGPKNNKTKNGASADIPITGDKTWPDYSDCDDDSLTLNSGTTQDDPQYRGLYRRPRGMSSNDASFAGATLGGESSCRSYSDNSSLSTSNTATNEWDKNLGRNNNDIGEKHQNNQHQLLQITGLPNFHDGGNANDDDDDDDDRLLFMDGNQRQQQQKFNNNNNFEEDFSSSNAIVVDVTLPAGKVGMVLNTPEGSDVDMINDMYGAPTVYQVKDTCPVIDQVRVGDRLIGIDGQDCTHLTAVQASRILSSKANQPKRLLTLARRI